MIIRLLVACFFVGSAILFAEVARANKWVSGERARKIIHILVGIWGAWLPLWLSWKAIIVLGCMLMVGVFMAGHLKLFKSIHSVTRNTVGEYLFPFSIILLALFFRTPSIFAASMLEMGVADGLAAVIGTRYGKKTSFKVFGYKKSRHGTITFFLCSMVIIFATLYHLHGTIIGSDIVAMGFTLLMAMLIASLLTICELIGVLGSDNITVPFVTALSLTLLK